MDGTSEIKSFYKGKTIFITGASGFMGKVLLEKLLYSCSDLDKIYILLRPKRGRATEDRLNDIFKLPVFVRIREQKPDVLKKVIPLNGEINADHLGLTLKQEECLIKEVHVVFHCAATLRLEAKLKDAVEMNLIGTKNVLSLAKQFEHLQVFVHLSTAFCHVDQQELGDRVYDSIHDPDDIIRLIQWMDESAIDYVTPKIIHPHPNTYTYTKRLAETVIAKEYPNMPCVIARPSIVLPSVQEPVPGWVDNLNGPIGLLVGGGKGIIRTMHCNADYHAEAIPVDFAINALITISHQVAISPRSKSIPVYNITQHEILPITWREVLDKGKRALYKYPFEGQVWYPGGDIHSSKFIHNLIIFFFHILPAYFIDFLMLIFRQKRFMVRIQKRISGGLELLQYFTTREWVFYNNQLLNRFDTMLPTDQETFRFVHKVNIDEYMKDIVLGARQYCMKEDLSSLPKARRHQRVMYVIHLITIGLFYYGILYFIYNNFEIVRSCLDYGTEKMKSLPFIGRVVEKAHF